MRATAALAPRAFQAAPVRGLGAADRPRHTATGTATMAMAAGCGAPSEEAPVLLRYQALVSGQLVKRYKRFLGDVQLDGPAGSSAAAAAAQAVTVVHVPNTGPMTGLLDALPSPALLSVSTDPKRKYAHTLEWLRPAGQGSWVGTHSAKANAMVRAMLEQRLLDGHLPPYDRIQAEVKYGAGGKSRVDFVLHSGPEGAASGSAAPASQPAKRRRGARGSGSEGPAEAAAPADDVGAALAVPAAASEAAVGGGAGPAAAAAAAAGLPASSGSTHLEVKSVTLAEDRPEGGRIALFPDTVSERAQKHVRELMAVAAAGGGAALLFLVQRGDCAAFAPCHEKDPVYGRLVRQAAAAGVRLLAVQAAVDASAAVVRFGGVLPLDLDYKFSGGSGTGS